MNQKKINQTIEQIEQTVLAYQTQPSQIDFRSDEVFAMGAKLMYLAQVLTIESGYKMEPSSIEGKIMISKIVKLLEMPSIPTNSCIGNFITEPNN